MIWSETFAPYSYGCLAHISDEDYLLTQCLLWCDNEPLMAFGFQQIADVAKNKCVPFFTLAIIIYRVPSSIIFLFKR